jgi:hypothetical protein
MKAMTVKFDLPSCTKNRYDVATLAMSTFFSTTHPTALLPGNSLLYISPSLSTIVALVMFVLLRYQVPHSQTIILSPYSLMSLSSFLFSADPIPRRYRRMSRA